MKVVVTMSTPEMEVGENAKIYVYKTSTGTLPRNTEG